MGKRSRSKKPHIAPTVAIEAPAPAQPVAPAWYAALAIAVATFAVYAQVVRHQFINFDDPDYVTTNEHVLTGVTWTNIVWAFTHVHASNWHPLTWISHMLDVQLFGLDAGKHLLVNVALHVINSVLLLFVLRRATGSTWRSATVAALFALHPLHVESVAWVSERKDVLSTLFFFLAIWFYLGGRRWLTFVAFICGVMAKPMVITLPFVLLLLDWWPLNKWSPREPSKLKVLAIEKWPLFLVIPLSAMATMNAQQTAMSPVPLPFRLANALLAYVAYLHKTIVPIRLAPFYPYPAVISPTMTILALALLVAITVIVLRAAARFPYLAVGWLWYLGTLVPAIGIVQVGLQSMADRYTYVPLIGIFVAIVWLIADVTPNRIAAAAAAVTIAAGLAVLTFTQAGYWRDSFTLFAHAVQVEPNGRSSRINLGAAYLRRLEFAAAADQFRATLASNDDDDLAHSDLGVALAGLGDIDGARREYETAVRQNANNPDAYRGLGRLELVAGRTANAMPLLEKSNALKPDNETTALLDTAKGDVDGAIAAYRLAIDRQPDSAQLRNDIGALLARKGDDAEALAQYYAALKLAPVNYDTRMNIGALLARTGHDAEAMRHFEIAGRLKPNSPEPHVYMALLYGNANRFAEAAREVRAAAAIDPALANAQFSNAVHIELKPANLADYLGALERKAAGRG